MSATVAVVTDSSAQLPAGLATATDITVVPVAIVIDDEPVDEQDLDPAPFWDALANGAKVTTSPPTPGRFGVAYDRLRAEGATHVLSVHLDARVSAVVDAARLGAEGSEADVTVVDTGQTSFGVALCALEAFRVLAGGGDADVAVARARGRALGIENVFVVGSGVGGRLGVDEGTVLSFERGSPKPLTTSRDREEASEVMVDHVARREGSLAVAVGHAHPDLEVSADRLASALASLPTVIETHRYRVGPSVAAHTGPWSFGAFFWPVDG